MKNNGYGYYLRRKRRNYFWKLKMRFVCNCSSSYSSLYVCSKSLIYIYSRPLYIRYDGDNIA